tara:strand:- start:731 stop:1072 length:342 start_codon:yes stop_codon:yes gene_type:complete
MENFIYKICKENDWKNAEKIGKFKGTKKDLNDGYIHFSKKNQIDSTLKKYFFNQDQLVLIKVKVLNLKNLKWERSQSEELYPHLYSILNLENVKNTFKIILENDGTHKLPLNL